MCRIGAFLLSLSVRTLSTPSAIACMTVSYLSARAMPLPRPARATPVQSVVTTPGGGG